MKKKKTIFFIKHLMSLINKTRGQVRTCAPTLTPTPLPAKSLYSKRKTHTLI